MWYWDGSRWIREGGPTPRPPERRQKLPDWIATAAMFVILSLLVVPLASGVAASPRLASSPAEGPAGATITVTGTDFVERTWYQLTWDGSDAGMPVARADRTGTFEVDLVVPTDVAGAHTLAVVVDTQRNPTGLAEAATGQVLATVAFELIASAAPGDVAPRSEVLVVPSTAPTVTPDPTPGDVPSADPSPSPSASPEPSSEATTTPEPTGNAPSGPVAPVAPVATAVPTAAVTPAPTPTATPAPTRAPTPTPAPSGCPSDLAAAIDATPGGGTLDIRGCTYRFGSDGLTLDKRITLLGGELVGNGVQRGNTYVLLDVTADGAIVNGTELSNAWRGARVNGTDGVVLRNVYIHHVGRTGIEIQNRSVGVQVLGCRIHATGRANEGNAEGIYVGSARSASSWTSPDTTRNGRIAGCRIGPDLPGDGIDVKDDSYGFVIEDNDVYGVAEVNTGAINVRGHDHTIRNNVAHDNKSSGFRFGGTPTGVARNHVVGNIARSNGGYGYKCTDGPQLTFSGNAGSGNVAGLTAGACQ